MIAKPLRFAAHAAAVLALAVLVRVVHAQTDSAKPFTLDGIFGHASVTAGAPEGIAWSPDGKHLTYLDGGQLLDMDPATGKAHVLISREKLASLSNDGSRDGERGAGSGEVRYWWSPDSAHLLFDSNGVLWLFDLKTGTGVNLVATGGGAGDDPRFSPDGKQISFVKEHGLCVIRALEPSIPACNSVRSGNPSIWNGEVDWVYGEELDARSNVVWSPDSNKIAYLQMDESAVPEAPIVDWIPTHASVTKQHYPQPGNPNPEVRVGVSGPGASKTVWMKIPIKQGDDYIPRFGWVDGKTVWVETLTRDHQHKSLYFAEASSGRYALVLEEKDDKYFPEKYDVAVAGGHVVVTSWADGYMHLYLYSYNPAQPLDAPVKLERQLTSGSFDAGEVLSVDAKRKAVYYTSNEGDPQDEQVWRVGFDGEKKRISFSPGTHSGVFSPNDDWFVDLFSSRETPLTQSLCPVAEPASRCKLIWSTQVSQVHRYRVPEQLQVKAKDGTTLYATLLLPEGKTAPASVPLILNPYGGPGFMTVFDGWPDDDLPWGAHGMLFDQLLAEHGFAVLHTDNRGMSGRGRAFEQAAYHDFGPVQLEDQLTVADAVLARYPQLDAKRQGWWGWSWGGTFTLYALTHSDRFRAGVAVAPVTDWRDYDSIYTERYLSQPGEFAAGYKDFSVVNATAHLHGHLLLIHGTSDDNVHFQNTVQFVQELVANHLPYDLQIYPRKTHSIAGADVRPHLYGRILAEFETYLMRPAGSEDGK